MSSSSSSLLVGKSVFHRLDGFAKTLDDFRVRTKSGGIVTLLAFTLILILFCSELVDYITPKQESHLVVDSKRLKRMDIYFNLTIPKVPCLFLSLDVMDVAGEHHDINELSHDVFKTRLNADGAPVPDTVPEKGSLGGALNHEDITNSTAPDAAGTPPKCGSCYGGDPPKSGCCYSCKDIEEAYTRKGWSFEGANKMDQCIAEHYAENLKLQQTEGCNLHGHLSINRVSGNFHFAPGKSYEQGMGGHIHDMMALLNRQFDFTHQIHFLSFGPKVSGMHNPLDNMDLDVLNGHSHLIQYFIKVVGTEYHFLNKTSVHTNQYSVTEHSRDVSGPGGKGHVALPGLFFNFDISPMRVINIESKRTFLYFVTSVCAIVGGVFTVAQLVDAAMYRTERALVRKLELGKLN